MNVFRKIVFISLSFFGVFANGNEYLEMMNQENELDQFLQEAPTGDVWDRYLKLQVELFADGEIKYIQDHSKIDQAENVLEIGSGNGSFIKNLSKYFCDKQFIGLEKDTLYLEKTLSDHSFENVKFIAGDAEELSEELIGKFDVVIFRFVLLHLKNPLVAIERALAYLKPGGELLILEANDMAHVTSPKISFVESCFAKIEERNKQLGKGDRDIAHKIFKEFKSLDISKLCKIKYANINSKGEIQEHLCVCKGKEAAFKTTEFFRCFFELVQRYYKVDLDIEKAKSELRNFSMAKDPVYKWGALFLNFEKK